MRLAWIIQDEFGKFTLVFKEPEYWEGIITKIVFAVLEHE